MLFSLRAYSWHPLALTTPSEDQPLYEHRPPTPSHLCHVSLIADSSIPSRVRLNGLDEYPSIVAASSTFAYEDRALRILCLDPCIVTPLRPLPASPSFAYATHAGLYNHPSPLTCRATLPDEAFSAERSLTSAVFRATATTLPQPRTVAAATDIRRYPPEEVERWSRAGKGKMVASSLPSW